MLHEGSEALHITSTAWKCHVWGNHTIIECLMTHWIHLKYSCFYIYHLGCVHDTNCSSSHTVFVFDLSFNISVINNETAYATLLSSCCSDEYSHISTTHNITSMRFLSNQLI
jgi:hypothetical protein